MCPKDCADKPSPQLVAASEAAVVAFDRTLGRLNAFLADIHQRYPHYRPPQARNTPAV